MKRISVLLAAAATAVALVATSVPASAAESEPSVAFGASSTSTVADIVNSAVATSGSAAVAETLSGLAETGGTFPGLEGLTVAARKAALRSLAEQVAAGQAPSIAAASRFVAPRDAIASLSVTEGATSENVLAAKRQLTTSSLSAGGGATTNAVGPGVVSNGPVSGGFAWQMSDYLVYYTCIVLVCTWKDRVDFRFTINGRVQTSKVDMTFNHVGDGSINPNVTVKAQTIQGGVVRATDTDQWYTPGKGTAWPRTDYSMLGKSISFKMTFTALTPSGVVSGTGSTSATKTCTSGGCNW